MSPALTRRALKEIREVIQDYANESQIARLLPALDRALLTRSTKKTRASSHRKAAKKSERASKAERTAEIRYEVFRRARDKCECCDFAPPTELHHAFGRIRVPQSPRNCLALCRGCHRAFTDNVPDAATTWSTIALIFARLGFLDSRRLAERRVAFVSQRAAFDRRAAP